MKIKCLNSLKLPAIGQGGVGKVYPEVIRRGIELDANLIDTAEIYGTEEAIGKAIKDIREDVIISTKFSPENNSYENVIKAANRSLKHFGYIDLYLLHWTNPDIPIKETIEAMERLVKEEKVIHIGFCNMSVRELKNAMQHLKDTELSAIQLEYNLFDRSSESLFEFCEKNKILFMAYSPLDRGKICTNKEQLDLIDELSKKYDKTRTQIALNWLTEENPVVAIPKADNIKMIEENASSTDFKMSKKEIEKISSFKTKKVFIPPNKITIREGYHNIEEAKINHLKYIPSPISLAKIIEDDMKPIRMTEDYVLTEGMMRYWAWVISKGNKPIPAFIRRI